MGAPGTACNSFIICRLRKLNIKVVFNNKKIVGISLFVCLYIYRYIYIFIYQLSFQDFFSKNFSCFFLTANEIPLVVMAANFELILTYDKAVISYSRNFYFSNSGHSFERESSQSSLVEFGLVGSEGKI